MDSFQHDRTQYLYKKRLDDKLTAKEEFDLPEIYGNIIQSLHETAKEVLGEKHKRQSRKMWWTLEIEGLVAKNKKLYQKWLTQKDMKINKRTLKLRDRREE